MGLPPLRGQEHQITLKDGTNPIAVHPYCYAQIQKVEIDKTVEDMLAGIVQPSSIPLLSPLLLVKRTIIGVFMWIIELCTRKYIG